MHYRNLLGALLAGVWGATALAADPLDETLAKARLDAAERVKTATQQLTEARARIAAARQPLYEETRRAEDRAAALEGELRRLQTDHEQFADTCQQLRRGVDAENRTLKYLLSQAQETAKALEDSLLPGERATWAPRLEPLQSQLEKATGAEGAAAALATADLARERIVRQLGGHTAPGSAVRAADNRLVPGTFAYVGPETFFREDGAGTPGVARLRAGGEWPVVHPAPGWSAAAAEPLFAGRTGLAALDASNGKALALRLTQGSWLDEVRKGGAVGLVILGVGLLAIAIAIQKLFDFRRLAVDEPAAVRQALAQLAGGAYDEAERSARALKATTRELFLLGLRHRNKPKALREEHLESFVLQQRMLQERRLPMLAVIATSGPLLGLLGTVTGMIKTFTLITVFGTGSAGKLSAGISEALVATKFGLMVAIPALVVHGFLSQRIQKSLALLERYALEIATAGEETPRAKTRPEVLERT